MSFYQQFATESISMPNRKRKEMDEDAYDSNMSLADRRKAPLPSGRFGGNQLATFHPLGAEDNLRMLQSLGLIPSQHAAAAPQMSHHHQHTASHSSASSASDCSPKSALSDMSSTDGGYFGQRSAYPNIDPYPAQAAFASAQNAMGMEVDSVAPTPNASNHGAHCTSLPQLFVSSEDTSSALWARCPSCSFSWKVNNSTLDYRPWDYSP